MLAGVVVVARVRLQAAQLGAAPLARAGGVEAGARVVDAHEGGAGDARPAAVVQQGGGHLAHARLAHAHGAGAGREAHEALGVVGRPLLLVQRLVEAQALAGGAAQQVGAAQALRLQLGLPAGLQALVDGLRRREGRVRGRGRVGARACLCGERGCAGGGPRPRLGREAPPSAVRERYVPGVTPARWRSGGRETRP